MALECLTDSMGILNNIFEGSCEQAVDCDITLPDYCSEILRVLKCTAEPCIVSSKISGDRACADGNALVRIIYSDENGKICSYEQEYAFSSHAELGSDMNGTLFCDAKTEYVNCRAVSRRRIEVHGAVRISFKICALQSKELISGVSDSSVQIKKKCIEFSDIVSCENKQFSLSETVTLPADYLPAERIINVSAVPILSQTKAVNGKILLKGETALSIIYCPSQGEECTVKFDSSVPINQVVDAEGISDECIADICLKLMCFECNIKFDEEESARMFDFSACINAEIRAYHQKSAEAVTDAYCVSGDLSAEYEKIKFFNVAEQIEDSFVFKNSLDFSSLESQKICALWFGNIKIKKGASGGRLRIEGAVPVYAIVTDSEGKPAFCEREFEFEYSRACPQTDSDVLFEPRVIMSGYTVGSVSDCKAEVKAEFILSANVFTVYTESVLVKADVQEDSKKKCGGSSMVIYFPDDGETVWDIARKYNTTTDLIKEENRISGDTVTDCCALIIPVI